VSSTAVPVAPAQSSTDGVADGSRAGTAAGSAAGTAGGSTAGIADGSTAGAPDGPAAGIADDSTNGILAAPADGSAGGTAGAEPAPRRAARWPGRVALGLALLTVAGVVAGIALDASDLRAAAWLVAFLAIGTSALAVIVGVLAAASGRGRATGVAGIVLGVVANPLLLTWGLPAIGGL